MYQSKSWYESKTWWGQRFIDALSQFTDSGRLSRGKAYSSDSRILEWEVISGKIKATVRGNTNPYYGVYKEPRYKTQLAMSKITQQDWRELIKQMSSNATVIARLLLDEIPDDIDPLFQSAGFNLLPVNNKDFNVSCSCPDYSSSCKHIAGVCYRLAALLDNNPLLLFELRGLSIEQLNAELLKYPLGKALSSSLNASLEPPSETDHYYTQPTLIELSQQTEPQDFWYAKKPFPKSVEPITASAIPGLIIKKGGEYPGFWTKSSSFNEVMSEFYERMRKNIALN